MTVPSKQQQNFSQAKQGLNFAILPLQNISEDPMINMFCKGLAMDLINDLSRFKSLQIISFESIQHFHPNEKIDNPTIQKMKLDYIVKGMVRYYHKKLLINLQLIFVPDNRLVWAERFGGSLEKVFEIQDEIVEKIVSSVQTTIDLDLLQHVRQKPLKKLSAYECWLRGMEELKKGSIESDEKARTYFQNAIEIDPSFSRPYTGMSLSYFNEWSCQMWSRWDISQKGASEWAHQAVQIDPFDHISNAILGRVYLFSGDYDKAEHFTRKALRLNPNDASNLSLLASTLTFLGHQDEAYRLLLKAKRLNPLNESIYLTTEIFIHFELGHFTKVIQLAQQNGFYNKSWVDLPAFVAAAYFQEEDLEQMQRYWQLYLDQFTLTINQGKPPSNAQALKWMIDVNPYRYETRLQSFWAFMGQDRPTVTASSDAVVNQSKAAINHFFREGDIWQLSYQGILIKMPDLKGFKDIVRLLEQPGREVHCTDLLGASKLEKGEALFDEKAKKAYQKRIVELQEAISEAESLQHHEQLAQLQTEYDQLIDHLSKATGIGGRTRKSSSSHEKARSAVTWRIRNSIRKIATQHPSLAKLLKASIKTGAFCVYQPEFETNWILNSNQTKK